MDGEWLRATHTTLGADNGIGVCAALALLEQPTSAKLPPLECLFTVDEEVRGALCLLIVLPHMGAGWVALVWMRRCTARRVCCRPLKTWEQGFVWMIGCTAGCTCCAQGGRDGAVGFVWMIGCTAGCTCCAQGGRDGAEGFVWMIGCTAGCTCCAQGGRDGAVGSPLASVRVCEWGVACVALGTQEGGWAVWPQGGRCGWCGVNVDGDAATLRAANWDVGITRGSQHPDVGITRGPENLTFNL
eukprot:363516-Chlamydomonas_euryale.AAC.15